MSAIIKFVAPVELSAQPADDKEECRCKPGNNIVWAEPDSRARAAVLEPVRACGLAKVRDDRSLHFRAVSGARACWDSQFFY